MGIVYRARDAALNRTVAIKMLRRSTAAGTQLSQVQKFFNRELLATASLQHKNIVTVYESGEENGDPYLVMECLDGEPVSRIIAERRPMLLVEKLDILVQVCDGLQYAHDRSPQVIHRDIKPGNVILLSDGTAKLVDFGIARIAGAETAVTQTGQLVGSLSYMSPEQINSLPIDSRTDIFSAGVLAYELVAYSLPFKGSDPASTFVKILREDPEPLRKYVPDIPAELEDAIYRALAKKKQDRYQTAEEFGFDLLSVQRKLKQGMTAEYLQRAETAIERGDLERARQQLLEITRLDRHHERANRLLAEVRKAIQSKERSAQVGQLRSQAHVALAGQQYEEALACIEQAVQLDPSDAESQALRAEIKRNVSISKNIRDLLVRAESAMLAGDLDDAKAALLQATAWQPENAEARALATVIEKEQAERTRRTQVQDLVNSAREGISKCHFEEAIGSLRKAEELDPTDSNVRELLLWATRGKEQEIRRRELLELTEEIDRALRSEDFSSAFTICELALARFPDEQTLVRLRAIAERQKSMAEKRRFVQDRSLAARELIDEGNLDGAIQLLEEGLSRIPGEPNFESLLSRSRTLREERGAASIHAAAQEPHRVGTAAEGVDSPKPPNEKTPIEIRKALRPEIERARQEDQRETASQHALKWTASTIPAPAVEPGPKKLIVPIAGASIAATLLVAGAIGWYLTHRSADRELTLTVETSPADASVQVNGQRCLSQPCTFSLPRNGTYEATANLAGYTSAKKSGVLSEDGKVLLELSRAENSPIGGPVPSQPIHTGRLVLTGMHHTDRLFIDGTQMAKPDKSGGWSVDPGQHHFKLVDGSQELFADPRQVNADSVLTIARTDFKALAPLPSDEQVSWDRAEQSQSISGYQDFLSRYPNSPRRDQAKSELESLYWLEASKTATTAGYRDFLTRYPSSQGPHYDAANSELERLEWQSIQNSSDRSQISAFLVQHPKGVYHQAAADRLDNLAWDAANRSGKIDELKAYLRDYPSGGHKDEANAQIAALQPKPQPAKTSDTPSRPASGSLDSSSDIAAIHSVLDGYQAVYESRSVDKLRTIFPGIEASRIDGFNQLFQGFNQIRAPYHQSGSLEISGNLASVSIVQQLEAKGKKGHFQTNSTVTMHLQKDGGRWFVTSLRCSVYPPTLFDIPC